MNPFKKYKWFKLLIMSLLVYGNLNGQNLEKYQWKNRILLIAASTTSVEQFQAQIKELDHSEEGLKERKLLVCQLVGDQYKIVNYLEEEKREEWQTLASKKQEVLDQKDRFKVMLIGLDGGIKLERTEVLKKVELYRIIDSMPMRRSELKHKKN